MANKKPRRIWSIIAGMLNTVSYILLIVGLSLIVSTFGIPVANDVLATKLLSFVRSDVFVGIVGVPLKSEYAPVVATVAKSELCTKLLSLVKSDVFVGIVGVPLRSLYAPVVATVANELLATKSESLVRSDVFVGIVGLSVRSLYEPVSATVARWTFCHSNVVEL